ncbi:MAG: hypothetical protein LBH20_11310 [Treponema sp.]|jgi:hypothetical protein|nr:hypothetical protein [Treponema sp.]
MKSWALLLTLLFYINVSLFAQAAPKIPLYVSPVEGTGNEPEDNDILSDLLIGELAAWNFILTATPGAADYTLLATLSPFSDDAGEKYLLSLSLLNKDGMILYEQTLPYTTMEEVRVYIPSIMRSMLSSAFVVYVAETESIEKAAEKEIDPDEWRKKLWYIGESAFWSPRLYYGSLLSSNLANFGFGISAEYHFLQFAFGKWEFLKYLSVTTGMEFVPDWVIATDRVGDEHHNTILQIPLRFSYVWRPGVLFMHQPFLGIHFNIPFYKDTTPAPVSWDIGFQFGLKAGPGIAYAEARYSMDFGESAFDISRQDIRTYQRFIIQLAIGYKYDLVGKIAAIIKDMPPKPKPEIPPESIDTEDTGDATEEAVEEFTEEIPEEST